jgi:site-specific recombinase XerD
MLLLGAYAGLRCSEICAVRAEDVQTDVIYVHGKGGQQALVPTHPLIAEQSRLMPQRGFWFPGGHRGHVSRKTAWSWITDALLAVGCSASPHQLRHWYGTQALVATGNLRTTQLLLRHRSITSTTIYTLVPDADRRAAIEALPR